MDPTRSLWIKPHGGRGYVEVQRGKGHWKLALGLSAPLSLVLQIGCFFPFTHTNLVLAVLTVVSKL